MDWAEREVRLACKELTRNLEDKLESGYISACLKSALKAYKTLCKDGHSNSSITDTRAILNRLIDHKPLTNLTGEDDEWMEYIEPDEDGIRHYQNKRYCALFKDVHPDGWIEYNDVERTVCKDIKNDLYFTSGFVNGVVAPIIPKIEFPYYPRKPYVITTSDAKSKNCPENSDFDLIAVYDIIFPGNEEVKHINYFYKEIETGYMAITEEEYLREVSDNDNN